MNITRSVVALSLICALGGCASQQKKESAGRYLDDSIITTKVKSAILGDPTLNVLQIGIETYHGRVRLSGFVDSPRSVARAGEVAKSIEGVKEVRNNLIVK